MTPSFEDALGVVLRHEGGWANDSHDPGGPTNYGITLRLFREWVGDQATPGQLSQIAIEDVRAIYRVCFWDRHGFERLHSQDVATKLFDAAVHMGAHRAVSLAQAAAACCGHEVVEDGVLGPVTVAAINDCEPWPWLRAFCAEQREFYRRLIEKKPDLGRYSKNWLKRAAWPFNVQAVA